MTHLPDKVTNYNNYQVTVDCSLTQQNRPKPFHVSEPQMLLYGKLTLEDAALLAAVHLTNE